MRRWCTKMSTSRVSTHLSFPYSLLMRYPASCRWRVLCGISTHLLLGSLPLLILGGSRISYEHTAASRVQHLLGLQYTANFLDIWP